ncbi:MAG: pyridoxal phosphate-dependent aminotransferase [Marinifilaceae bacterium]
MNTYEKPTGSYISHMSNLVKEFGGINLAQGIPGFMPPKELLDILASLAYEPVHQYAPGTGNKSLKEGLANHYTDFEVEDFLITNGGTEAITIIFTYLMKILPKNFTTLAFDPVYEVYNNLPSIYNKNFISFSFSSNGSLNIEKLRKTVREQNVKIVFINTPGNPYGRFWTKEEFDAIIKMGKKEDFYIIIDAVYNELYFEEKPYLPLDNLNENVFYTNSFSKLFSVTGWRIGYLVADKSHMTKIQHIHDYIGLCSPSVLQEALARFIKNSDFGRDYVSTIRENLKVSFNLLKPELEKLEFLIPETKGGYFIWAKLPERYTDSFDFAINLYNQQKLAVIPGIHFSKNCNNYIRFNIARNANEIYEAISRLKAFCK